MLRRVLSALVFLTLCLPAMSMSAADSLARIRGAVQLDSPYKLSGNVGLPLDGCVVQLFFERDGQLDSLYTISANHGRFSFINVPVQRVVLRLQCLGYESQSGVYELGPGDNVFVFTMKVQTEEIDESKVTAEIPLMKQLKDTTIFNTRAIKSMPGDGLREVLEQIPGFKVTDTDIYVEGVKVSRTYVNGLLIFGDEAINAVNALKADDVTQVKVYDEQSAIDERRGKKNSRKERVMNVVTTEKFVSLSQWGVAASGGVDDTGQGRYAGAAAISFDSEMTNINVGGWGSNLEQKMVSYSPSSVSDLISFYDRRQLKDYSEDETATIYMSRHWRNRRFGNSVNFSYNYEHLYYRSASQVLTDYFATETEPTITQSDSLYSKNSSRQHKFVLRINLLDTPLKSFTINLAGDVTGRNNVSEDICQRETGDLLTYSRHESASARNRGWKTSASVEWTNNDVVKWRPSAEIYGNFDRNTSLSWTVDTLATSFLQRQLSSDGYGNKVRIGGSAGVSASLINDRKRSLDLNLSAKADYNRSRSRQMTVNEWEAVNPVTDIANSYDYTRNDVTVSAVGGISYSTSKNVNISGELSLNGKVLLNDEFYPVDFNSSKNFIYPEFRLDASLPEWNLTSSLTTLSPSVEQISNRVSDTNPLVLTGGNPDLNQSYSLTAGATYRPKLKPKGKGRIYSLDFNVSASCTFKPIASRIMYFDSETVLDRWDGYVAQAGSMLYTFSNAQRPSWRTGIRGHYSTSVFRSKLRIKTTLSGSYGQTSQFSNYSPIWVGDLSGGMNFMFRYVPIRILGITDSPGLTYLLSHDQSGKTLSSRAVFSNSFDIEWFIIPKLKMRLRHNLRWYDYLAGAGENHFTQTLDVQLEAFFLKDRSLQLSLQAIDLLNSGSVYETVLNASYMSQTWKSTYGRYFMLNIAYTFRKKR